MILLFVTTHVISSIIYSTFMIQQQQKLVLQLYNLKSLHTLQCPEKSSFKFNFVTIEILNEGSDDFTFSFYIISLFL